MATRNLTGNEIWLSHDTCIRNYPVWTDSVSINASLQVNGNNVINEKSESHVALKILMSKSENITQEQKDKAQKYIDLDNDIEFFENKVKELKEEQLKIKF